ncbi:sel1 repeat family protein [Pigmentiphaga aceris]|uniref:Sel1 repeat family protein n=1 Tax=Pigmentiphaga aceris TaxID=1940612 RepID=A0A5C0AVM8_9BURK|nr:tetratricopeptide repeat protein [Pigmentiphaga aceris]QEI06479.1 sel1 repeat family protein [Pigmentiphaga aceris]
MNYRFLTPVFILALAACAQNTPTSSAPSNTVRICDDLGCSQRPKSQITADLVDRSQDAPSNPQFDKLRQLAESDPRAAYDLGLRYFRGDGVRQDSYQALVWMRKAGEGGDLQAQKALGGFYLAGLEEMGADPREAEKWLTLAAGRGDEESRALLAQASEAKRSEQAAYKWHAHWRSVYHRYWYSGYAYRWHWRQYGWYWN